MAPEELTDQPYVSIVVLTFNSQITIRICLDAIFSLDYPPEKLEVIVVDNGSTDATAKILKDFKIKNFLKPEARISELRNFGARETKGQVLGFIDSDCQIEPDWIRNALAHLASPEIGIVGCNYDIPNNAHWIEKSWNTNRNRKAQEVSFVPAGNMIIRRALFEEIGGFDETLETGEDTDLCARIKENGYKVISDPEIRNIHWGNPRTMINFVKREIWYGKGMVRLLQKQYLLNKIFLMTNTFIFMHVAILTALFFPIAFVVKIPLAIVLVLLVLFMMVLSALYRCRKLNVYTFFPQLVVLCYLYFVGRAISLIRIYSNFLLKRDRAITSER